MHRCTYLSCYTSLNNNWSVASCLFNGTPYVPSVQELESYCKTGGQQQCPVCFQSRPFPEESSPWPELEVAALAQCR